MKDWGWQVSTDSAFLQANSEAYEWLIKDIQATDWKTQPELALQQVVAAARFAAVFHTGRFADGAIENLALDIGIHLDEDLDEIDKVEFFIPEKGQKRQVLHVATDVQGVGGHTRMLCHWISNDHSSCHSLILLNQLEVTGIPKWLVEAIQSSGGQLKVLPVNSELRQKARWLRSFAKRSASLVVLHHSPFDIVPTVAFAISDCPPVAVLNHADHLFWLGSSVADIVINLRTPGSEHSSGRRFINCNTVLPIPLVDSAQVFTRSKAREMLGIPDHQCVLLSVGRGEKYRPCGLYDFVVTANKILDLQPDAHLYVVGESEAGISPYLNVPLHKRLHFMGSIDDPSPYLLAADIYLESFPFGSNTALLEAALSALPVVPAFAPLFTLLVANNDALANHLPNPTDEEAYIERVDIFVNSLEQRREFGATLRSLLLSVHTTEGWLEALSKTYQKTDDLIHNPHPIPIASCSMTSADIGLGLWHVAADGRNISTGFFKEQKGVLACHKAFVAKEVGHFRVARQFAWSALLKNPFKFTSWRLVGVTLLGKSGRLFRQLQSQA